jgi:hypothetical protein
MPKNILIAPLDWGLGHTTRCIPLIRYIQSIGHIPVIAGNHSQRIFIEETFPGIKLIHLDGYNITYSKWNKWAQIGLLAQLPKITAAIKSEHQWLLNIVGEHKIDGIISDNRYGLFHPAIPSVIMTHQLQVISGFGDSADQAIQKLHYKYLNRFQATWVVDAADGHSLGGKLSHARVLPRNTGYIGLLSQFDDLAVQPPLDSSHAKKIMILLSGPEPQRSILSQLLWKQAVNYKRKIVFVEGSKNAVAPESIPEHICYHKRLTSDKLLLPLGDAEMVICRSGYSTLMDLMVLRKKAILIPTPGQTEQEYLGRHLHEQDIFYCAKQSAFKLDAALAAAHDFPYKTLATPMAYSGYKGIIEKWIEAL